MFDIQTFLATHQPKNGRFFAVAIDGRGGSGKTTFAALLRAKLPDFVVLHGDDYFEPIDDPIRWGAFNEERFVHDVIKPLQRGNMFAYRPYDWHASPHITERTVAVQQGLLLERCYSFQLALAWDFKIWVETPREVCLQRGVARETLPPERLLAAWRLWQGREDTYIETFRPQEKADVVIDGLQPFAE